VTPDQLVVCSQNHDQIGNRARGERLSMLVDAPKLKAIAALVLLAPFVPLLFQGEEWGASTPFLYFTDHENAELGRLVSEGRAREFEAFRWGGEIPDPQDAATFERSKLDWAELREPHHAELRDWYRALIALRKTRSRQAAPGKPKVRFDVKAQWLRFEYAGVLAMFNFASVPRRIALTAGAWELALDSHGCDAGDGEMQPELPAQGTRIFQRKVD
jgi:maltooligosyltrehalose trehalohydrolase